MVNINNKKVLGIENITYTSYGDTVSVGFCTGADILHLLDNSTVIDGGHYYFSKHIASLKQETFEVVKRTYTWRYTKGDVFGGSGTQYILRTNDKYEHLSYNSYFSLPTNPLVRAPRWAA